MSNQPVNTGTTIGDGTGDGFHASCLKINANFAELYARAPAGLSGMLAADAGTGYYRVAVVADISFAGVANGLATLDSGGKVPAAQLKTGVANGLATLDSGGQVPTSQLPAAVLGSVDYQGTWNASANTPAIPTAASGNKGWYYKASVAGTTNINGNAVWNVGDWIVSDGTVWERVSNTDAIQSVAGLTGIITAVNLKTALAIAYTDVSGLGTAAQYNIGVAAGNIVRLDATTGKLPAVDGSQLTNMTGFVDHFATQLLHVRDEKTNGTAAGSFVSGAWQTRTLNTVKTNEISGASLSSNQITLPAGTYFVSALVPGLNCDRHRAKLYNVTDSADIIIGGGQYASNANGGCTDAHVHGRFTIAGTKVIELRHYCSTTGAFGQTAPDTAPEVYAVAEIWKVGP